jgi:hypothetical protein
VDAHVPHSHAVRFVPVTQKVLAAAARDQKVALADEWAEEVTVWLALPRHQIPIVVDDGNGGEQKRFDTVHNVPGASFGGSSLAENIAILFHRYLISMFMDGRYIGFCEGGWIVVIDADIG